MILNAGAAVVSGGTSSEILNAGLEYVRSSQKKQGWIYSHPTLYGRRKIDHFVHVVNFRHQLIIS